jgi:hypothetical protein
MYLWAKKKSMQKKSILYGVLAGIATMLYLLGFYFYKKSLFLDTTVCWSSLVFYLIAMFKATADERERLDYRIDLKQAISAAFVTFVVANVIYHVFIQFMTNTDVDLITIQLEKTKEYLEWAKTQTTDFQQIEQLNQQLSETSKQTNIPFSFNDALVHFAQGCVGGFILAMGIGAMMKTE